MRQDLPHNSFPTEQDGRAAASEPGRGSDPAGRPPLERAFEDLLDAGRQLRLLAELRAERSRLRLRRNLSRMVARAGAAVARSLLLSAGVLLVAIGVVVRLRAVFSDQPGMGELISGALLIAVAAGWAIAGETRSERLRMRQLKTRHGVGQAQSSARERA
jgi:hypothetical protein